MNDERDRVTPFTGPSDERAPGHLPEPAKDTVLTSLLSRWPAPEPSDALEVRLLESYRRERATGGRRLRPRSSWLTAAAVLFGCATAWWLTSAGQPGRVSAQEVLTHANRSATTQMQRTDVVLWRSIAVEERTLPANTVVGRRRVDVWRNGMTQVTVRRVYDEHDRLEGGEWIAADGRRTLYRRGSTPVHPTGELAPALSGEGMAWRVDLSAAAFTELAPAEFVRVRETNNGFTLSWDATGGPWIRAELTLAKDYRALAQTITVKDGERGTREIRFRELDARALPPTDVPTARFEPEADLKARAPTDVAASPGVSRVERIAGVSDAIELQVWHQLHRLGFLFDRTAQLERHANGRLTVRLALPAGLRPEALGARLNELTRLPGVSLHVGRGTAPATQAGSAADDLAARLTGLREFVRRWPVTALERFDSQEIGQWSTVVRDHALAIGERAEQLRHSLSAAADDGVVAEQAPVIADAVGLSAALDALFEATDASLAKLRVEASAPPVASGELDLRLLRQDLLRTEAAASMFSGQWAFHRHP